MGELTGISGCVLGVNPANFVAHSASSYGHGMRLVGSPSAAKLVGQDPTAVVGRVPGARGEITVKDDPALAIASEAIRKGSFDNISVIVIRFRDL